MGTQQLTKGGFLLRLTVGSKKMSSCVIGVMVLEGSGSLCTSQYVKTTNLKCFPI